MEHQGKDVILISLHEFKKIQQLEIIFGPKRQVRRNTVKTKECKYIWYSVASPYIDEFLPGCSFSWLSGLCTPALNGFQMKQ